MRLPPQTPGRQWAALSVATGIYPDTHFDQYYWLVQSGDNTTSHAFHFGQDFTTDSRGSQYFHNTPSGEAWSVGPVYLWDGVTLHTYGNISAGTGSGIGPWAPKCVGLSYTIQHNPLAIGRSGLTGRKFWSPVRQAWIAENGLTSLGRIFAQGIGTSFWTNTLVSEGVTYVPGIVSDARLILAKVDQWNYMHSPRPLRRRLRQGPYMAEIQYPPAFPTPQG